MSPVIMSQFFAITLHLLIVFGFGAQFYMLYQAIFASEIVLERKIRAFASFTGLMIYFASAATGNSIGGILADVLSVSNPWTFGLAKAFIPAVLGYLLSTYLVKSISLDEDVATRVLILASALALCTFGDLYLQAVAKEGARPMANLAPNAYFIVGIGLHFTLRYRTREARRSRG